MSGNENQRRKGSQSDSSSSISLSGPQPITCCCSKGCQCNCTTCIGRINRLDGEENASSYKGQGGLLRDGQKGIGAYPITISPTMNSLSMPNSFRDFQEAKGNSYDAPAPRNSQLTRSNIKQLEHQSGGSQSRSAWLQRLYKKTDENPGNFFLSPEAAEDFDMAGAIEGGNMDDEISLHVSYEHMTESLSMLSQFDASLGRGSASPSMFLPEVKRNLVHRPLSLTPERHNLYNHRGRS